MVALCCRLSAQKSASRSRNSVLRFPVCNPPHEHVRSVTGRAGRTYPQRSRYVFHYPNRRRPGAVTDCSKPSIRKPGCSGVIGQDATIDINDDISHQQDIPAVFVAAERRITQVLAANRPGNRIGNCCRSDQCTDLPPGFRNIQQRRVKQFHRFVQDCPEHLVYRSPRRPPLAGAVQYCGNRIRGDIRYRHRTT